MSFDDIVSQYLDSYPPENSVHLCFGSCNILFETNHAGLADFIRDYFIEFAGDQSQESHIIVHALETPEFDREFDFIVKQPDPGKRKIKEEYIDLPDGRIVRKVITGLVMLFGGSVNLAVGPCVENDSQVVNFIIHRYIEWLLRRGGLLLHAAGVSKVGSGIALAGFSGMGKSTLALHLMNRGTDFVSNDRAIVRTAGGEFELLGVPKMPRINPGTIINNPSLQPLLPPKEIERFRSMSTEELWRLEDKHDAMIHKIYGPGKFQLEATMRGLVVLNWSEEASSPVELNRIDIEQRQVMLPAFTKSTGLFNDPRAEGESIDASDQAYIEFFSRCPIYEITGRRNFEAAVECCLELLE